ncbi:MAG: exodeoxyribonuclease VII large subunit [Gammaproteobacteria bacterium]|uniref:Exodeoxyribonuclease 7 large subunit n=1 Tax=SAR86 cluster bacterium TaxID=2030880 RepID=A0A520N000_9GAMM|nr:MAG: exodeoxyribonuclease VII large subunit [SAR86 cluster bacterium]|tara:strand:- start:641 stop:1996 length:1356 start_codon:yes stop_codon:yes gene_type:complete
MEDYSTDSTNDMREILSVSEVNKTANDFINEAFPPLWVVGEISGFKEYGSSGHWYFSLKDSESVLSCSMFRLQNISLGFKPKEGDQVIIQGKLSIWHKTGRFQIIASKMELAGFGELLRKYELLKNKLKDEGLFSRKLPESVPEIINKLAVVTSPHGAALRDIISTLKRRAPHINIIISPCQVQGEGSEKSILKAVDNIAKIQAEEQFDAIIISRGGGSIEDLWSFNNEELCRYISRLNIPVISGIGHQTDFTLLDFVSNQRAETPTAAAEIASEGASKLQDYLDFMVDSLKKKIIVIVTSSKEKISFLKKLLRSPKQKIQDQYLKLDHKSEQLHSSFINSLNKRVDGLEKLILKVSFNSPEKMRQLYAQKLLNLGTLLSKQASLNIDAFNSKINNFEQQLVSLSPKEVLKRGYSITYGERGNIVKSSKKVFAGDKLLTQFNDGKVQSKVE